VIGQTLHLGPGHTQGEHTSRRGLPVCKCSWSSWSKRYSQNRNFRRNLIFSPSAIFFFENWITTHRVSFQELKVGRAWHCLLNLNPNSLWPLHAADALYRRVVCLQFPKISKKREILNFRQNQNLGGAEISNHQITTNKPRYAKAEFSKTLCCMPKLFPKHSLLIHLLVVEIYHEMSKNKKCPTQKNVGLKFRS